MQPFPTTSYASHRFRRSLSQTIALATWTAAGVSVTALLVALFSAGGQAAPGLVAMGIGVACGVATIPFATAPRRTSVPRRRIRSGSLPPMQRADTNGLRPASAWPTHQNDAPRRATRSTA